MPKLKPHSKSRFTGSVRSPENRLLTSWLKGKRISKGLTMRQVGNLLNIPHSYISKIENRERRLDVVEYVRYCQALSIDPLAGIEYMELPRE